MKRPNLKRVGREEGKETKTKSTENAFNKIIEENFTSLKKEMSIKVYKKHTEHKIDKTRKAIPLGTYSKY